MARKARRATAAVTSPMFVISVTSTTSLTSQLCYLVLSPQTLDEKSIYTEEELREYEQELANEADDLHKKTAELQKQREELQRREEELNADKLGLQQVKGFFPPWSHGVASSCLCDRGDVKHNL